MTASKPPIFVVGSPRSGTTLMRTLLSAHPNIYITHEPWFYIWDALCPPDVTGDEFLRYYFNTFSFRWLRMAPSQLLDALPSSLPRSELHVAFREIMRQKAAALGRERYGEKTPGHLDHLPEIFRDFPDARVIHMVRDPRATVDSSRRMVWGCQRDLGNCIVYERGRKRAQKFEGRILEVKLEELRLHPETELRRILDFAGEEWSDDVLDHSNHIPDPNDMPPVPWLDTARERLVSTETRLPNMSPERVRLIETVCGKSMQHYGYEKARLESAPGTLNTWARIASEVPDTLRFAGAVAKTYKRLKDPKLWSTPLAAYGYVYRDLNPAWWADNSDFVFPTPPELSETESASALGRTKL